MAKAVMHPDQSALQSSYDVIVVGGGPGGSAAAIACAQANLRVALLEQCSFPRNHPGETLHPGVEPLLRQLGVWEAVQQAGFLRHAGVFVDWGDQSGFVPYGADATGAWFGLQAWRADFDSILLLQARVLGVTLWLPCRVRAPILDETHRVVGVVTPQGELRSRFVIDATGGLGWLARYLSLPQQILSPPLVAQYGYVTGDCPARDEYPAIIATDQGWVWTARVRPQLYQWTSLGFEVSLKHLAGKPKVFQHLSDRLPGGRANVTWRWIPEAVGLGYFMVGDAAAVLDPASSHGVLKALMTGIMAAHLITQMLAGKISDMDGTIAYQEWLRAWLYRDVVQLKTYYQNHPHPPAWLYS
jgi:flavin-dependent dehydrogenase